MVNYCDYILFFSFYSFMGWVLECIYAFVKEGKLINRGFLAGCFCPIYGFGAILILQSSKWISGLLANPISTLKFNILFAIALVTLLEYITGFLLERIFNCKWWDYSDIPLNIHGYICPKFSILWGILASLLIRFVHPAISDAVYSISVSTKGSIAVLLLLYFLIDTTATIVDTLDLRKVILDYPIISPKRYSEKIVQSKRLFRAFPRLKTMNAGIKNRDIRRILHERMDKIKFEFKSRFIQ